MHNHTFIFHYIQPLDIRKLGPASASSDGPHTRHTHTHTHTLSPPLERACVYSPAAATASRQRAASTASPVVIYASAPARADDAAARATHSLSPPPPHHIDALRNPRLSVAHPRRECATLFLSLCPSDVL